MARISKTRIKKANLIGLEDESKYTKYLLTISNPVEHNINYELIKESMTKLNYKYYCLSSEYSKTGTLHYHVGILLNYDCTKKRIKNLFPTSNIQVWHEEPLKLKHYVFKINWSDDKDDTRIPNTQYENGYIPSESIQGKRTDLIEIYKLINEGKTCDDIINLYPQLLFKIDKIDAAINRYMINKYANTYRKLLVTYIYGSTGIGKTRYVKEKYGYKNVYSIFNYKYPFDNYRNEKVILFDEFHSQIPISHMLQYLDGYPLMLPCRYSDKTACYTNVYILSNLPLKDQYKDIQKYDTKTWNAFLRRINYSYSIMHDPFDKDNIILVDDNISIY